MRATAVLVAVAAIALVLLPWFASQRVFGDLIAEEFTRLTGARVILGEPPHFSLFPTFSVKLRNVRFEDGDAVLDAAAIDADLDIHQALTGTVRFRRLVLDTPSLVMTRPASPVRLPFSAGRIGRTIHAALAGNAAETPPGETGFGTVAISGGRIVMRQDGHDDLAISGIDGDIVWPAFERTLKARATGQWQTLPLSVSADIERPLLFVAGKPGPARMAVDLEDSRLTFDGEAAWVSGPVASGRIAIKTGSFGALLGRFGFGSHLSSRMDDLSFSAAATTSGTRMKFEDADISVDGQNGTGAFDLDFGTPRPAVSGTVAFKDVDLTSFAPALAAPSVRVAANMPAASNSGFGPVDVDLRLSADVARLGPLPLRHVAASMRIQPELAAFDISDAETLGGSIQAGIHALRGDGPATELQFSASEIDMGVLVERLGLSAFRPSGPGSFSIILKGPSTDWAGMLEQASGNLSARFGPGSLGGITRADLVRQLSDGGPLRRSPDEAAALKVDGLDIRAPVTAGLVLFEKADFASEAGALSLSGIMSLRDFGLALTGRLAEAGEPEPARLFFVGGTLDAPVLSPIGTTSANPGP
ncbi:MAG: AsmA-like C-terminal region-containing protein [Rhizobiaceae bacterium]